MRGTQARMSGDASRPGGIVLPFRRPAHAPSDAVRNDEWDSLVRLAREAWEWRDPESVGALAACLQRLRGYVLREWSA